MNNTFGLATFFICSKVLYQLINKIRRTTASVFCIIPIHRSRTPGLIAGFALPFTFASAFAAFPIPFKVYSISFCTSMGLTSSTIWFYLLASVSADTSIQCLVITSIGDSASSCFALSSSIYLHICVMTPAVLPFCLMTPTILLTSFASLFENAVIAICGIPHKVSPFSPCIRFTSARFSVDPCVFRACLKRINKECVRVHITGATIGLHPPLFILKPSSGSNWKHFSIPLSKGSELAIAMKTW